MARDNERGYDSGVKANAQYGSSAGKEKKIQLPEKCPPKKDSKQESKSQYGSWGPIYKDKKTFTDMHIC